MIIQLFNNDRVVYSLKNGDYMNNIFSLIEILWILDELNSIYLFIDTNIGDNINDLGNINNILI